MRDGSQGVATVFDAANMLRVLAVTIGAPLAAGILIARVWPRAAALSTLLARVSLVGLVAGGIVALVAEASEIVRQAGHGVLVAIAVIILFGMLVGHLLGGPDAGNRGALALATSARHPGPAIALSTTNFPHDREAIIAAVPLFLLANLVLLCPMPSGFDVWRFGRKREAQPCDGAWAASEAPLPGYATLAPATPSATFP